jgi:opacity protein-like surface antigen
MKKVLACIILTVSLAVGLSAESLSLSAGGGGLLGYTFTRYTLEAEGSLDSAIPGHIKSVQTMDRINYGGFLFFDATYGEAVVSLRGMQNSYEETMDQKLEGGSWNRIDFGQGKGTGLESTLGFAVLGKYPFRVNEKITWFPLLGVECQIALVEERALEGGPSHDRSKGELEADRDKDGNSYPLSAWNSLTIDLGAGLDYQLTGRLFLRNELLFSFRLQTPYETGALEMVKAIYYASDPKFSGLTGGPTLRTSVGYRFRGGK